MKEFLEKIAARLESGSYVNEAAVRIGIIEPILARLGWDTADPLIVTPEYSSEGRRVDYALCAFPNRAIAFIEAKAVGKVEAADRQLFEYAFHEGVPFAILTVDGPGVSISHRHRVATRTGDFTSSTYRRGHQTSAREYSIAT